MNYSFTENQAKQISISLHRIYEAVVFDENTSVVGCPITPIAIESVEIQNELDKVFFAENKGVAFAHETHNELTERFLSKIKSIMNDTFDVISEVATTYANVTDIMAVTVPYVLLKFGVDNQEVGLFIGLGILVSQIIVERITEKKANTTKVNREDFRKLIEINKAYLDNIAEENITEPLLQYKEKLSLLMSDIDSNQ
jgi:hypothetical protein